MGKKRSFQWQAVYEEANVTDYKTHAAGPHEADPDDMRFSRAMEGHFHGGQPVAPKVLEPNAERARARELRRQDRIHQKQTQQRSRGRR